MDYDFDKELRGDDEMIEDDRHVTITLTDAQIEIIAERVEDRFYKRLGKKVADKILWLIGIVTVGLVVWLSSKGAIK